ncbi:MAG: TonB-dependent receptor [Acidobacteriota bacterium]
MRRLGLFTVVAALAAVWPLAAQETRGSLLGRVTDPSGAVMPGANVEAVHAQTGVAVKTVTNEEGIYQLLYLLPGMYNVTAQASGFKTLARQGIEIRINDRVELNLTLEVGAATERIEVVGETPLLQTATASMGQVVDHRRISELPLLHGNPMAVLELTPGLAQARTADLGLWGGRVFDNGWTTSFQIDGSGSNTHEVTLDGVSNTTNLGGAGSGRRTVAYTPPADLVEELKVQTASYDASVGFTSGAVINMSVKPGSRDFHGTAYYFKIAPEMNANQWFANRAGLPKVDFSYNRWGGSNTGPVYIPKLYNGREKTFYSYGYEGHHDSPPWPITYTVPTPEELSGNFSALLKVGPEYQVYDPATARLLPNGRVQRDPFAGNVIPSSRFSSFTQPLTKYWGAPRTAGTADGADNFPDPAQPDPNLYYSHVARIDHSVSNSNRLYGRLGVSKNIEKNYRDAWKNEASGNNLLRYNRGVTIDDVHTFSPSLVLDVRYGITRFREDTQPKSAGFNPTQVGFDQALISRIDPQAFVFPCFTFSDFASLGCNNPSKNSSDVHDLTVAFNAMRGAHNLKFGGAYRAYRYTRYSFGQGVPRLDFGNAFTRGPLDNSPAAPIGQGLASFLLGIPTGGNIDRNASFAAQNLNGALYVQDDWKVTRTLTLTFGLRWEHEGPMTERFNRGINQYDFSARSPLEAQVKANYARSPLPELPVERFNLAGGYLFAGVGGNPRELYRTLGSMWMPRIGLAWNVTPKTVVRAGYGTFYGYLGVQRGGPNQSGFSQNTSVVSSLDNGLTFRLRSLANPFPDGLLDPPGSSLGLSTFLGRSISYFTPDQLPPYMQRWQVSVQRETPGRILVDLAYVGNRGTHLEIGRNLNSTPLNYLSTSPVRDQPWIDHMTQRFPNPFYPLLPGTGLSGTTLDRAGLVTPYPHFTGLSGTNYQGFSWYHSLQLKVERRFANGLTFQSSYTWSKMMEAIGYLNGSDPYPERVISGQDFPQRFSVSAIYELPFGKGRPFLGSARGVGGHIISGWQVQGVYTGQSGQALGFGNAIFFGDIKQVPLPKSQRTAERWVNTDAGFERRSARALSFNLRTLNSRFNGVRGDGINQWNLSLIKNTRITESKSVQFRAEAINALNHVQFVNPNMTPTSSAFGTITDEKSSGRAIQLGFKFLF